MRQLLLPRQEDLRSVLNDSDHQQVRKDLMSYDVFKKASSGKKFKPELLMQEWMKAKGGKAQDITKYLHAKDEEHPSYLSGYSCPVCEFSLVPHGFIVLPDDVCPSFKGPQDPGVPEERFLTLLSSLKAIPVSAIIRRCSNLELMLGEWIEGSHSSEQEVYQNRIDKSNDFLRNVGVNIGIERAYKTWSTTLHRTLLSTPPDDVTSPTELKTPPTLEAPTSPRTGKRGSKSSKKSKKSKKDSSFGKLLSSYTTSAQSSSQTISGDPYTGKRPAASSSKKHHAPGMLHVGYDGYDSDATPDKDFDSDGISNWSEDD